MIRSMYRWLLVALLLPSIGKAAEEGKVTVPMSLWEQMLSELEAFKKPDQPTIPICPIERRIEGNFRKGLFSATLVAKFQVLDSQGHVRVPVLDAGASVGEVLLDGKRTSLLREGGMYTLGVDKVGIHEVVLRFFWGKEQDRFARHLAFQLPAAGVTRLSVFIPEEDIEPTLAHGALSDQKATGQGTQLTGSLDASGLFDLAWTRKLTHRAKEAFKMDARLNSLFTIHEAMVNGLSVFDLNVLQGETDRVDLRLPPDTEVVKVEGDSVLQWRTEATNGGKLTVLLRYLVEKQTRIAVHFQFPTEAGKPILLRMPLPPKDIPVTGTLGVQGPAGLNVQVASKEAAKELTLRDLPQELTDLTQSPLLFGFNFTEEPRIQLTVSQNKPVELTSTVIDELLASTVLIEDGTEVTKLKVRIRNNTRQHLIMRLPEKAQLTHSLIDGRPVRPAVTGEGADEALLFPLRQSERIGKGSTRFHTVRDGETLSDIANLYYSAPGKFQLILDGNRDQLPNEKAVYVGQQLRIPTPQDVTVEESSFVIELAYKLQRDPLGSMGRVKLRLPKIDVDVLKVTWHLYFPESLAPLSFDANLTQYSAIHYDPFRRVRDFLQKAFWERNVFANGNYVNVFKMRKEIYYSENEQRGSGEVVLSSFPLVGQRYRFKRSLLGQETPEVSVTYVSHCFADPLRWGVLLAAFVLGLVLLIGKRRPAAWISAAAALVLMLILAYFFLGIHRRILWGMDLALLVAVARLRAGPVWRRFKELVRSPWALVEILTLRNLAFVVGSCVVLWFVLFFPLLLSSTAAVVLFFWWRRKARLAREEVAHA